MARSARDGGWISVAAVVVFFGVLCARYYAGLTDHGPAGHGIENPPSGFIGWLSVLQKYVDIAFELVFVGLGALYLALVRTGSEIDPARTTGLAALARVAVYVIFLVTAIPSFLIHLAEYTPLDLFTAECSRRTSDYYWFTLDNLFKGALVDLAQSYHLDWNACTPNRKFVTSTIAFGIKGVTTYLVLWTGSRAWKAWRGDPEMKSHATSTTT